MGQAKRRRRTEFGKKFAVQFHQLIVKAKITSKFAKRRSPFAKFVRQKKLLILPVQKKLGENVDEIDPSSLEPSLNLLLFLF